MVTSKIIRANKKTLVNSIDIDTKKRKLSTREKVINALKSHKRGLPLMEIADKANVSSGGTSNCKVYDEVKRGYKRIMSSL